MYPDNRQPKGSFSTLELPTPPTHITTVSEGAKDTDTIMDYRVWNGIGSRSSYTLTHT